MANVSEVRNSRMRLRRTTTALASLAVFGLATVSAQTQLAIEADVQIGSNYIDFGQFPTGAPYAPYPGYGTFLVAFVDSPGLFSLAGVTTGESGSIQSINEASGASSMPFITFAGGGSSISLYKTGLPSGSTSGPLTLSGSTFATGASFDIDGFVSSSTSQTLGAFIMVCSTTIFGLSPPQVLATLAGGTPINAPLSCSVSVAQTAQQAAESITNAVNALYSQGVLNGGQDKSLVKTVQQAINLMSAGKNAGAIQNLELFVGEVTDLLSSGVLTAAQANPMISAAQSLVARLS